MSSDTASTPRLLDQVRELIRIRHYSIRTEQAYLQWIRRYIIFHGRRHPRELGAPELTAFLSDLAIRGKVAASTQNQALNAILFLYRDVLKIALPWLEDVQRAKRSQHLPVVLTQEEVKRLLAQLEGTVWLMASVTYGAPVSGHPLIGPRAWWAFTLLLDIHPFEARSEECPAGRPIRDTRCFVRDALERCGGPKIRAQRPQLIG